MYKVFVTAKAQKELGRLSSVDVRRVLEKISLLSQPFEKNLDIKKLVNVPGFYRLRTGKIRVIFEIDQRRKKVWIRKIGYRGSVYG